MKQALDFGFFAPSGAVVVNHFAAQTFTFTPAANHHVASVTVDGVPVAVAASYTFTTATAPHTFAVTFALDAYPPTASAGAGGTITAPVSFSCACTSAGT